jgi:tellurite resistance protein TehA-like permease
VPYVLARWQRPTIGVSFVLVVATESLATLAAALVLGRPSSWLAIASLVCVGLGLAFYVFVARDFDLRQLLVGRGDHWVAGGALAIATLACGRVAKAAPYVEVLRGARGSLAIAALAVWAAAIAWLPALLACEAVRRRPSYDVRRWSTVFPLGMYAVCSFAVADVKGIPAIRHFAEVWIWVAFAVWAIVFTGLLRRALWTARAAVRAPRPQLHTRRAR